MKKTICLKVCFVALLLAMTLAMTAQKPTTDTTFTDTTSVVSFTHLNEVLAKMRTTLSYDEYMKVLPMLQEMAANAQKEWIEKLKRKK